MVNNYNLPKWLVNSPTYYVVVIGLDSKYLFTNDLFNLKFKHISEDFKNVDFRETIIMDDYEICLNAVTKCLADSKVIERVIIRKPNSEGSYIWTSWDFSYIESSDGIPSILSIGHDLTDFNLLYSDNQLKEQKLNALLTSSIDGNILIDLNFKITDFNDAIKKDFDKLFNIKIKIGDNIEDYLLGSSLNLFYKKIKKVLQGKKVSSEWEININSSSTIWYKINYTAIFNSKGDIAGIALNIRNIDQRKKTQIKLMQKSKHLEKIAWNYAHEVRRPLANILGLIELLNEDLNPFKQKEIMLQLSKSANELDIVLRNNINK
jgi:PAS domain S-box-containing protein